MKTEHFEKKIGHLAQNQILAGGIDVLNTLLIMKRGKLTSATLRTFNRILLTKKIATAGEIQEEFLNWMGKHGLEKED